ncbi:hypothetical protein DFP72DRAFT_1051057 [Ephemerocybe angulata]|uniref:Uncharacterized protein n=1 Tax=Ephemerocybe angulata TaxID=980116 RepID=A0A8H6HHE6_9AGAR|nr:hypothetical protein DFP72DRAFT_1051057 [Tulosesus angulatus]
MRVPSLLTLVPVTLALGTLADARYQDDGLSARDIVRLYESSLAARASDLLAELSTRDIMEELMRRGPRIKCKHCKKNGNPLEFWTVKKSDTKQKPEHRTLRIHQTRIFHHIGAIDLSPLRAHWCESEGNRAGSANQKGIIEAREQTRGARRSIDAQTPDTRRDQRSAVVYGEKIWSRRTGNLGDQTSGRRGTANMGPGSCEMCDARTPPNKDATDRAGISQDERMQGKRQNAGNGPGRGPPQYQHILQSPFALESGPPRLPPRLTSDAEAMVGIHARCA